jgi:hypothetical protein
MILPTTRVRFDMGSGSPLWSIVYHDVAHDVAGVVTAGTMDHVIQSSKDRELHIPTSPLADLSTTLSAI